MEGLRRKRRDTKRAIATTVRAINGPNILLATILSWYVRKRKKIDPASIIIRRYVRLLVKVRWSKVVKETFEDFLWADLLAI